MEPTYLNIWWWWWGEVNGVDMDPATNKDGRKLWIHTAVVATPMCVLFEHKDDKLVIETSSCSDYSVIVKFGIFL